MIFRVQGHVCVVIAVAVCKDLRCRALPKLDPMSTICKTLGALKDSKGLFLLEFFLIQTVLPVNGYSYTGRNTKQGQLLLYLNSFLVHAHEMHSGYEPGSVQSPNFGKTQGVTEAVFQGRPR